MVSDFEDSSYGHSFLALDSYCQIVIVTSNGHQTQLEKAQEFQSPVQNFNFLYNCEERGQRGQIEVDIVNKEAG